MKKVWPKRGERVVKPMVALENVRRGGAGCASGGKCDVLRAVQAFLILAFRPFQEVLVIIVVLIRAQYNGGKKTG